MITVVSGLPRSGTSMMMQMLKAGGIEPVVDDIRGADEDNPKGYFEFEKVKKLKSDSSWLSDAEGKSIKIISQLLFDLPLDGHYKVLFLHRKMSEILASQSKMIERRGTKGASVHTDALAKIYGQHLNKVSKWLSENAVFELLYVDYHDVIDNAVKQVELIHDFLDCDLDIEAMCEAVDPALYRQKKK